MKKYTEIEGLYRVKVKKAEPVNEDQEGSKVIIDSEESFPDV